jgi:hypothetical protein
LRDQLCFLIRQHNLDPTLVKAYAADFCGTQTLSGARRELVESFISHLSASAKENRDALVCKLNSYVQPQEAKSWDGTFRVFIRIRRILKAIAMDCSSSVWKELLTGGIGRSPF